MRLSHGDNQGLRYKAPMVLLTLNRDQVSSEIFERVRGGSGLNFSSLGRGWVLAFGFGLF
jgi:hypothetical protein